MKHGSFMMVADVAGSEEEKKDLFHGTSKDDDQGAIRLENYLSVHMFPLKHTAPDAPKRVFQYWIVPTLNAPLMDEF